MDKRCTVETHWRYIQLFYCFMLRVHNAILRKGAILLTPYNLFNVCREYSNPTKKSNPPYVIHDIITRRLRYRVQTPWGITYKSWYCTRVTNVK